jgi:hypothetical protein
VKNNCVIVLFLREQNNGACLPSVTVEGSAIFKAAASSLIFAFDESTIAVLNGDGTRAETWAQLEELPNHCEGCHF